MNTSADADAAPTAKWIWDLVPGVQAITFALAGRVLVTSSDKRVVRSIIIAIIILLVSCMQNMRNFEFVDPRSHGHLLET